MTEDRRATADTISAGSVSFAVANPEALAATSAVKERPILFSAPMVRALLAGTKTQTRRVVKGDKPGQPLDWLNCGFTPEFVADPSNNLCPYGVPGDRLWVREAHYLTDDGDYERAVYAEDAAAVAEHLDDVDEHERRWPSPVWPAHRKLRPSIHMPRWASRLSLTVTDVRVERLQDISDADAVAEGCPGRLGPNPDFPDEWDPSPQEEYRDLWNAIDGADAWAVNPWVWAVTFEVEHGDPSRPDAALRVGKESSAQEPEAASVLTPSKTGQTL